MANAKKSKFWFLAMGVTLAFLGFLFSPLGNHATAMLNDAHVITVLWRVKYEIMPKSPAGQYYEAMFWSHSQEQVEIINEHPEHSEEFLRLADMFVPGLEALMDGKGDTVQITDEQIKNLKAELDWYASVGSLSLREDIEKEQQRFPLENFVGMTMSEAQDYVNSNFPPGLTAESIRSRSMNTATPQPTPTATCLTGPDANCRQKPALVPNSNKEWAYDIHRGVYFEYPSNWQVEQENLPQVGKENFHYEELILRPVPEAPEAVHTSILGLGFLSDLQIENWDPVTTTVQEPWERSNMRWKDFIYLADFQGFECYWYKYPENYPYPLTDMNLEVFLYNENKQVSVVIVAVVKGEQTVKQITGAEGAWKMFPNMHHIVDSIRLSKP